jgi:hypothetical protein
MYQEINEIRTDASEVLQSAMGGRICAIVIGLTLWSATAWGATLTWDANSEPDLQGYRIYRCTQLPCGRATGSATLVASVGTVTSFSIGTPTVVQYYFLTAYDLANNESSESAVVTYTPTTPTAAPPPPPAPGNLQLRSVQ